MLRSEIFFGVVTITLFSFPSRGQEEATSPPTHLPLSAHPASSTHPPLVLIGQGAAAVTFLRGRERVVVLEAGDEQHFGAAPLPCSPSPDPVLLEAGQSVALKSSLGHLPSPCKWLFQFQESSNVIHEEYTNQTNEGYSNLTIVEYSNLTNETYSNLTSEGYSNQTTKDYSNVTNESDSNPPTDDFPTATGPAGFLKLVCGELILVGKDEIDVEPDEEDETTGKSGRSEAEGGVEDASEQFDELKCKRGNYLLISDGRDRRERICGYLQDFTWRSETGLLRVRLRAKRAGGGMGDFEMGGCSVSAI